MLGGIPRKDPRKASKIADLQAFKVASDFCTKSGQFWYLVLKVRSAAIRARTCTQYTFHIPFYSHGLSLVLGF